MSKAALAVLFAITAALYASVGFGGGSTYTALLAVSGLSFTLIPIVSLACNIVVVSGNSVAYLRRGLVPWAWLVPILLFSVPAAWLGGRLEISETLFIGLLWVALAVAGWRLVFSRTAQTDDDGHAVEIAKPPTTRRPIVAGALGAGVGFYSGLVGIGGGIFLAPILHHCRWGRPVEIAAAASVFILVNSMAGLIGQLQKLGSSGDLQAALSFWPLLLAVALGGTIGNRISLRWFTPDHLRRATGVLVLFVAARLAWRWIDLLLT